MTPTQTWVVLGVLIVLTGLEVAVAMSNGGHGLVTVALFVLAIAQAGYFALVAMGLGGETTTMKKLVAIPLIIAAFYALVLCIDAVWRAVGWVVST
ncbi:MAG: cytochrome C oxidase subunit IV family protein [Myxococcaceae bacterium]